MFALAGEPPIVLKKVDRPTVEQWVDDMRELGFSRDEDWTAAALTHLVRMYYVSFIDERKRLERVAGWITEHLDVPYDEAQA